MFRRRWPLYHVDYNTITWRSENWRCARCWGHIKRNQYHSCLKKPETPTEKEPTVDEEEWPTEKEHTVADFDLATPTTKQIKDNQTYLLHSFLTNFSSITSVKDFNDHWWNRAGTSIIFKGTSPAGEHQTLVLGKLLEEYGPLLLCDTLRRPKFVIKDTDDGAKISVPSFDTSPPAIVTANEEELDPGSMAGTPTVEDTPTGTPAPKMGWVCPVCGRGLAPWMDHCKCKSPKPVQNQVTFQEPLTSNDQYRQTTSGTWLPLGMR